MPYRAPSICGHCGKAHGPDNLCARAARIQAERKARFDKKRPSARQRGYDSEWERESKAFLARPENKLCRCGKDAVLVAHILSIRSRPDLRMNKANWRPSCQRCNAIEAADERRTQRT
jgi:5-methylcytosine-specific restriction endonuclease McrA